MAFAYYAPITVDHTKVPNTDQTNFPVLVSGTYDGTGGIPNLKSAANSGHVQSASGFDIQFFADSGLTTRLPAERVIWKAATGQVEFWVQKTLTTAADTVIYIAYGDSGISTDPNSDATYGKNAVWDANYKAVYHFGDGTTLDLTDSTATGLTGTNHSATAGTGQVGGALALSGSAQYVDLGLTSKTFMTGATQLTAELWLKTSGTSRMVTFGSYNGSSGGTAWSLDANRGAVVPDQDKFFGFLRDSTSKDLDPYTTNDTSPGLSNGSFHHVQVTWVYSGTTGTITYDGVAQSVSYLAQTLTGTSMGNFNRNIFIGALDDVGTPDTFFNGMLDELRFSSTQRSADWATTSYNNQSSPATFYTMGSETAIGGASISTTGIASTAVLGSPVLTPGGVTLSPIGIASTVALGSVAVSSTYTVGVTGIASTAGIGSPTLSPGSVNLLPTGLASTASLGAPTLTSAIDAFMSGLGSTTAFGTPTLSIGASNQTIYPASIVQWPDYVSDIDGNRFKHLSGNRYLKL